ncbi:MAG: nucleotidyltransferase [Moorea sp. SIO3G5]|nr:nucleotidyltransferase [Moorena sp. SIO3G5]
MSVANQFNILCDNLKVPQITRHRISDRYKRITKRLNIDFWKINDKEKHSIYVGSYGRGTAVKGFSDLDIIFILPLDLHRQYNSYQSNGQSALLQSVKKSLQATYSTTDIGGDGQVVVIQFTDGIKFEVVPAFDFEFKDSSFRYPDSNNGGSWKTTNPRPEIETIKENDKLMNGNLINLCRMARAWKKEWNVPMGGLLIDTLANKFLESWEYKDKSYIYYDWMSRDFLKYLSNQTKNQEYWYAVGSNQHIYRKGNFEYKAKQCYLITLEAINYQSSNMNYYAKQKWREIYGTSFPE